MSTIKERLMFKVKKMSSQELGEFINNGLGYDEKCEFCCMQKEKETCSEDCYDTIRKSIRKEMREPNE